RGHSEAAILFYEKVFYATHRHIVYMRDSDADQTMVHKGYQFNHVLYGCIEVYGTKLHFSDMVEEINYGNQVALSLVLPSIGEFDRIYHLLKEHGSVPLHPKPEAKNKTAVVYDQFHITWHLSHKE
ncbi:MAG: hypothetical protein ACRCZJ_05195, partial [Erysipelotrichaceae bacterium]